MTAPAAYQVTARIRNNRLLAGLEAQFGKGVTIHEAARRLGVSPDAVWRLLAMKWWPWNAYRQAWAASAVQIARGLHLAEDYLFDPELYGRPAQTITLEMDRPALEATGMLALPMGPDDVQEDTERREKLAEVLQMLRPNEAVVLRRRFGLDDGQEATFEAIGNDFGVGRERIRQIEAKALRKLRHPSRSKLVRDFYETRS